MSSRKDFEEHPFAAFLKIIARGPTLSRSLTFSEARGAMAHILSGNVEPEQLGAFLLLLRQRGETAEELAGFVSAARTFVAENPFDGHPDLDWPTYADRHRQQPWFILSALLLARDGVRILMHGIKGEETGFASTRPALAAMGIPISENISSAIERMKASNIAYIGLESIVPHVEAIFHLRPVLGLRTLVNTFARILNPCRAPSQIIGVVHPPYRDVHQKVAEILEQPASVVFKGGGGEAQRNPLKPCVTLCVQGGVTFEEEWPVFLRGINFDWRKEDLSPDRLPAIWEGRVEEPAVEAAIIGTAAIGLRAVGKATSILSAEKQAQDLWKTRLE